MSWTIDEIKAELTRRLEKAKTQNRLWTDTVTTTELQAYEAAYAAGYYYALEELQGWIEGDAA